MKTIQFIRAIILGCGLIIAEQQVSAQGTYLSNLNQPVAGNNVLGYGDSAIFVEFLTGNNAAGYDLNSVQVLMTNATGTPDSGSFMAEILPINQLVTPISVLSGNSYPSVAGTYTYTAGANVLLSADTDYWLMLFGHGTDSGDAFQWSYTSTTDALSSNGWSLTGNVSTGGGVIPASGIPILAIDATAVPEPNASVLLAAAGVGLFIVRAGMRKAANATSR